MAHIIGTVSLNKNVYSLYDIARFEKITEKKIKSLNGAEVPSFSAVEMSNPNKKYFGGGFV